MVDRASLTEKTLLTSRAISLALQSLFENCYIYERNIPVGTISSGYISIAFFRISEAFSPFSILNLDKLLKMPPKKPENKNCILVRVLRNQANLGNVPRAISNYFGSVCHIPTEDCKSFNNFEEFEINGVITVFIHNKKKKFEVLAELLNNKVLNEKPGLLISEVGESQLTVTARSSRSEVDENGPTETDENGPKETDENGPTETDENGPTETDENGPTETDENGPTETDENGPTETDENGPNDDRSATLSSKRKLPLSKSFEMLSFRDDRDWSSQNNQKNCLNLVERIASDYFDNHQKLLKKMERMEKYLECLPKILTCMASNQNPIFEKSTPEIVVPKNNFNEVMTESLCESDDEKVEHDALPKALLLRYINLEIPERSKNLGLDKIKIEYPNSIKYLKQNVRSKK
ncbi:tryptophan-rich antigen [Brachionus plicatilis]|uniref:Tryptophan-rich antigen n=1 Tax=Brachionus plicatilis TaxID=10195 RepID=A0A3M7RDS1_BRAPC|nr:tryptophan-rich antigen [Brachionus plicatilis]